MEDIRIYFAICVGECVITKHRWPIAMALIPQDEDELIRLLETGEMYHPCLSDEGARILARTVGGKLYRIIWKQVTTIEKVPAPLEDEKTANSCPVCANGPNTHDGCSACGRGSQ